MNIILENINESHFPFLLEMFHEFSQFQKVPERMTNTLEKMQKEKAFLNGFIAKTDKGEIVGYVTFFNTYYTWTGKALYMDDLYVRERYRGMGVGKLLIENVMNHAKMTECYKLRWQVTKWNKNAIEFYLKLGAEIDDMEMICDFIF